VARLPFPDVQPGPLRELLNELHRLHARAGWPSVRELARGQNFSHTAVHELFTKPTGDRKWTVLSKVVEKLARLAPRMDQEATLKKFDQLWDETIGRAGIEEQDEAIAFHQELEATSQYREQMREFAAALHKIVDMKQLIQQAQLPTNTILDVLNGVLIPRDEVLLRIFRVANVSDEDIKRLIARAAHLRESKRRLEAQRPGI
jgi:hypothetical protein